MLMPEVPARSSSPDRVYLLEQVDDAAVVQVYADGFSDLSLDQKILMWHLSRAAIAGRDIYYDQRYAHNLEMRDVLEAIVQTGDPVAGRAEIEPDTYREILRYTKLFWINTGPYNNLTARKFVLGCTPEALRRAALAAARAGARFPRRQGETLDQLLTRLEPMFFDPDIDPTVTSKNPPAGRDILAASANNLHVGVTMSDLDRFRERYPLNSRLVKTDGRLVEEVYRIGGRYDREISAIVSNLERAMAYATEPQGRALAALITFYRTGETTDREAFDIAWVADRDSPVDTINGFTEVYLDARGAKGAWEALVFHVNREKTAQIEAIAANAQWFEDRMPWDPRYRKERAVGITARAVDVVIETGDSGPITPVGINLPNDETIRERYGSKSLSLVNIHEAFDKSTLPEFRVEFSLTRDEADRAVKWSAFASALTTNLHEVIGHGSGKVGASVEGNPQAALKEHFSTIEESRADLVALYFVADRKLVDLGLIAEGDQQEVVRAEYEAFTRNALVQLRRIRSGTEIEEDHMRNRQLIVNWLMSHTNAIRVERRDGRTFYTMVDAAGFRAGVAELLAEVQRIKSEGDYLAARVLVETYGVHFDPALRDEVVARVDRLRVPSYTAFVMPRLEAITNDAGAIVDVAISYPCDLTVQMLEYSAAETTEVTPAETTEVTAAETTEATAAETTEATAAEMTEAAETVLQRGTE
jgi:dipeptidyl-peptidase III